MRNIKVVLVILLGFFVIPTVTVKAWQRPVITDIESLESLIQWYGEEGKTESLSRLINSIRIEEELDFSETSGMREMDTGTNALEVGAGGVLVMDNPIMVLQGPETVITVEEGGRLELRRGSIYTGPGNAIVVKAGGEIIREPEFQIFGGEVLDENRGNNTPTPTPTEQPQYPAIANVIPKSFDLFCTVDKPPLEYPESVIVTYEEAELVYRQRNMPVSWCLDTVDFHTPGIYEVQGSFTKEDLEKEGLSNPENLGVALRIIVQKQEPIADMQGRFVRIGANGEATVQLRLPALPEETEALYLYGSADGENWEQLKYKVAQSEFTDFLLASHLEGLYSFVTYRYKSDYKDYWIKAQVVGSVYEGYSNAVCIEVPQDAKPGIVAKPGSDPDDGSLDGNRGGGGQQETDRLVPTAAPQGQEETVESESDLQQTPGPEAALPVATTAPTPGTKATPTTDSGLEEKTEEELAVNGKPASAGVQDPPEASSKISRESGGILLVAVITISALAAAALVAGFAYHKKKSNRGKHSL